MLAFGGSAFCQEDPNVATGLKAFGTYNQGNIDRINVSNGALSVDIPIISYPQRGGRLKLNLALHYENRGNYADQVCTDDGDVPYCAFQGPFGFIHGFNIVQEGVPVLLASASDSGANGFETENALVMTPDGGTHALEPTNNSVWGSIDGSGYQAIFDYSMPGQMFVDTPLLSSAALYAPDGTLYRFPADTNTTPYVVPGPLRASGAETDTDLWISSLQQDRNGNQITFSSTSGWTDTVGRPIPVPVQTSDFSGCPGPNTVRAWTWNLPGVNGGTYPIETVRNWGL